MDKSDVDSGTVQFGKTAADYATHRPGFPTSFFSELKKRGYVRPNLKTLDVGTGTGSIARGLNALGCYATGLDPAEDLLYAARTLGPTSIQYVNGQAEKIPFADQEFDLICAGQCWHWFDLDSASKEISRSLKADGRLIIANLDWQVLAGNVVETTLKLIPKYNPEFSPEKKPRFYTTEPEQIATPPGFTEQETYMYVEDVVFSLDRWCGRIRASAAVGASMVPEKVQAFEKDLRQILKPVFRGGEIKIPHFVITRVYTKNK